MKRVMFGVVAVLLAAAVEGQEARPASAPAQTSTATTTEAATSTEPAAEPALVSTAAIQPGDSDLVRAAKMTLARRQKTRSVVIDNKSVKNATGARVSEPTHAMPDLPKAPPESKPIATPSMRKGAPEVNRAEIEARIKSLKNEQERLSAEALEAPYTETDEGATAAKLEKVQKEIDNLQKKLDESTPQPPL